MYRLKINKIGPIVQKHIKVHIKSMVLVKLWMKVDNLKVNILKMGKWIFRQKFIRLEHRWIKHLLLERK